MREYMVDIGWLNARKRGLTIQHVFEPSLINIYLFCIHSQMSEQINILCPVYTTQQNTYQIFENIHKL